MDLDELSPHWLQHRRTRAKQLEQQAMDKDDLESAEYWREQKEAAAEEEHRRQSWL